MFVPFDPKKHREDFIELNVETNDWHFKGFKEHYNLDVSAKIGKMSLKMAEANIEVYGGLKPPQGIFYIIYLKGEAAGMGAIRKHGDSFGELKRMYNRPKFRGRGLGKLLVKQLLEDGKMMGCKWFGLNTPRFAFAAQGLYKSVGFKEVEVFPEVEIGDLLRQYYLFMEKRE